MSSYWFGVLEWLAPSVHHVSTDFDIQTQSDIIELEDWASLQSSSAFTSPYASPFASAKLALPPDNSPDPSVRQRRKCPNRHSKSASSPATYLNPSPSPPSSVPTSRSTSKSRASSSSSTSLRPSHSSFAPVLLIPGPGGINTSVMFFSPVPPPPSPKHSRNRTE